MPIIANITPLSMSTSEANVAGGPLPYQILGDRYEYWTNDSFGIFYVKLEPPEFSDQQVVIVLRNEDTNEFIDVLSTAYDDTTDRFSFTVDVDALDLGNYIINILLVNEYYENEGGMTMGGAVETSMTVVILPPDPVDEEDNNPNIACPGQIECDNTCRSGIIYNGALIPAITVCNSTQTIATLLKPDGVYIPNSNE